MSEPVAGGALDYDAAIAAAASDPQTLERLYQSARPMPEARRFMQALEAHYLAEPDNLLYAAWHYRLNTPAATPAAPTFPALPTGALRGGNWRLAIPLSVLLGLVLWLLSDPSLTLFINRIPLLVFAWAPIVAVFLIVYLAVSTRKHYLAAGLAAVALLGVTVYALIVAAPLIQYLQNTYLVLAVLHIPLLAACAVGYGLLGPRSSATDRLGFLTKGIEALATAGVASIVGGAFVGLTYGLFAAISVEIPEILVRLLIIGGGGLIPLLTVAAVYDPTTAPGQQDFRHGFSRLLKILSWALLPLTLLVLVIYLIVIPFNFAAPFQNRDILIVYNAVLFAVIGLIVSATPVHLDEVPARLDGWLRGAILAIAAIVALISIYALAAVIYRAQADGLGLTMNRIAIIGWNVVNIGILGALLAGQLTRRGTWLDRAQAVLRWGTVVYLVWGAAMVLALPWVTSN